MKTFALIILFILSLPITIFAQLEANMLSCESFFGIEFNGASIQQLNETHGDQHQIQQLLGDADDIQEIVGPETTVFQFGSNRLSYSSLHNEISAFIINDANWSINIADVSIEVGMSLQQLEHVLGYGNVFDDLVVHDVNSQNDPVKLILIACNDYGVESFQIEINPNSLLITKISYYVYG